MKKTIIYASLFTICVVSIAISLLLINNRNTHLSKEEMINYLIKARQANIMFKYHEAHGFYNTLAKTKNPEILEEYLLFLTSQRNMEDAFDLSQEIVLKSPKHYLANLILTTYFIKNNKLNEAISHLQSINPEPNSIHDITLILLRGIKHVNNNDIKTFEKEAEYIRNYAPDLYYYVLGLMYAQSKDYKNAKILLDFVSNNYPNIEAVMNYAKLEYNDNPTLGTSYVDTYLGDNFLSTSEAATYIQAQNEISIQYIYSQILIKLASIMTSDININLNTSNTFILSNLALMLNPNDTMGKILVANFYEQLGNYDLAINFYNSIPSNSVYKRVIFYKILDLYNATNDDKSAIIFLEDYGNKQSNNPIPRLELGRLYTKDTNHAKAIAMYKEALKISLENKSVLGEYLSYYYMGVTYDKMGNWELAESNLLLAKAIDSKDPLLINYLAYSWIEKNKNLNESLAMLKDAIKLSPSNANILDSYAWGLFKTKDYKNALIYAKKANNLNPYDSQLNNHLGDIYYVNGNKDKAMYYWKSAENLTSDQMLKNELKEKLSEKLPQYLLDIKKSK